MIHNIPLLCRMGFNKCTEHLGMSDMKTMMKYLTAASFIVVAPFVNADDHSGTEMCQWPTRKTVVASRSNQPGFAG